MPKLRQPSHKMMTFACRVIAGDTPLEALENSTYATADWNNSKSKAVFASELLEHPLIAQSIAKAQEIQFDDAVMSRQEALERLSAIARGNITDLLEFRTIDLEDRFGRLHKQAIWAFRDSDQMSPDELALISELSSTPSGIKIKLRSADNALKQLARICGWDAAPKTPVGQGGDALSATKITMTMADYKQARADMLAADDC